MKKTVRRGIFLKKVKDIGIAAAFSVAVSLGTFSCTEEEVYEKGVQTFITETETGVFKIVDEKTIDDPTKSVAIVTYLNGRTDTLNVEQAEKLAAQQYRPLESEGGTSDYVYRDNDYTLSTVLLVGGVGMLMGAGMIAHRSAYEKRFSGASGGGFSRFYSSSNAYSNSRSNMQSFTSSRSTRSGFFSSSRSYGG
jgi:hypothetical protein